MNEELDQVKRDLAEAVNLLRSIEHTSHNKDWDVCPVCYSCKDEAHEDDCELGNFLERMKHVE